MRRLLPLLFLLTLWLPAVWADDTPTPQIVAIAGSFQAEVGCGGIWNTDCEATFLTFDETHQLWTGALDIPAGEWEYKVALNGAWDENYGLASEAGGPNIALALDEATTVTFIYDHDTHYIADDINRIFANLPGSFNAEIGCPDTAFDDSGAPGDWAPDCWQTLLQDPDGDGIYLYATDQIPPGNYETKVAVGGSWSENYGEGGAPGGANVGFTVVDEGKEVAFQWDSESKVLTILSQGAPKGNLTELAAYWVLPGLILTPETAENSYTLHFAQNGGLQIGDSGVSGGETFNLAVGDSVPAEVAAKFPHLANLTPLILPEAARQRIGALLRGQTALGVTDAGGDPVTATGLQIPGVLDARYAYDGPLGVSWDGNTPTLRVWAPTAQTVRLHRFANSSEATAANVIDMTRDDSTGVWSFEGTSDWKGQYYLYEVTVYAPSEAAVVTNLVTDPYSLGLALNSTRSLIVDLDDPQTQPDGWQNLQKPPLAAFEDIVLYELHLRDFSISDESVPENLRGTFLAFSESDSSGMQHLRALADAGLTHIHLLPLFDIATINEDKEAWRAPLTRFLANFDGDSEQQQQAIGTLRDEDGFNWGYDPYHYTVPEGSYSTEPDSVARIREFRQMVQALNQSDLRVVMDVVYNHTNSAGQSARSVLDRIVPGYYHRLNSKGKVENSTCCANTATEHDMMRKLMIDSLLVWAEDYKVDGFRFDLMGHHMVDDMRRVRSALDRLTLADNGVNGAAIYVYGEGWNFGEVVNGARGPNATQLNVGGLGIGTFNDRIRDAVRGGNPFGGELEQGFGTGLLTNPNPEQGSETEQQVRLLQFADQIRAGLAANLADYELVNKDGNLIVASLIPYGGSPTAYTEDPQEVINYVSAHDNETLFDAIQLKVPLETSTRDRARYQNLSLDLVMLAQGVPFFHAGSDILRSKSLDRNSYNSGDWFNRIDWTYQSNNFGVGLPPAADNESKWPLLQPLLANESIVPAPADILFARDHFREMLQLRKSSPLFRLRTAEQVAARLSFANVGPDQIPGLIVMLLDDSGETRIDPNYNRIVVLFNGRNQPVDFTIESLAEVELQLHPLLQSSVDSVVAGSSFSAGTFSVPALTTAVFVEAGDANSELESEFDMTAPVAAGGEEDAAAEEGAPKDNTMIETLIALAIPMCVVGIVIFIAILAPGLLGLIALGNMKDED